MLRQMFWAMCSSITSSSATQLISLDNLVSYYKLDGSLGYAYDSNRTYDASFLGTGVLQNQLGKVNTSFTFNSSSAGIDCSSGNRNLNFGTTQNFSISFWMKSASTNTADAWVISKKKQTGAGILIGVEFGLPYVFLHDPSTVDNNITQIHFYGTPVVVNENWHHLILTVQRDSSVRLYVNGVLDKDISMNQLTGTLTSAASFTIGRRSSTTTTPNAIYYNGAVDEVGVWNRVLSATEVSTLYSNGYGLTYPFTSNEVRGAFSASDNFNSYKDGSILSDYPNWGIEKGVFKVYNPTGTAGEVYCSSLYGTNNSVYYKGNFNKNQYSQATYILDSCIDTIGVSVRNSGGNSIFYSYYVYTGTYQGKHSWLYKDYGNTLKEVSSNSQVWTAGDVMRLEVIDSSLYVYKNGAFICGGTDASIKTGNPGISGYGDVSGISYRVDNWSGGDL
jgi:hypothetical protein